VPYSTSAQGYEIQWATNYLGHVAWTLELLDILIESQSRVVIITGDICILENDTSPDLKYDNDYASLLAYCRSKVAVNCFAYELQHRYPDLQVRIVFSIAVRAQST
jgi:NAD(P)-dependent dehydrogenase (short-subunit alcohol dehydrogenase family)